MTPEEREAIKQAATCSVLVGRTITAAEFVDMSNGNPNAYGEFDRLHLTLDDGTLVRVIAWGQDSYGVDVELS